MRYYKVMIDYRNYISVDETEMPKAIQAFMKGVGAVFSEGATRKIEAVLPDNNRMMGWNPGYFPNSEELGEIMRDELCRSAKHYLAEVKSAIALNEPMPMPRIASGAPGMKSIGEVLEKNGRKG